VANLHTIKKKKRKVTVIGSPAETIYFCTSRSFNVNCPVRRVFFGGLENGVLNIERTHTEISMTGKPQTEA